LIILIDPTSFSAIASQLPLEAQGSIVPQVGNPKTVIDNITQFYRSSNGMAASEMISIPTAFVLTKIDALKGLVPASNSIFSEARHQNGFDRSHCERVSIDVKKLLMDQSIGGRNLVVAVEAVFKDHLFFAVTSLGKPPKMEGGEKRADNISPKNPENPWLWILYRLGFLSET
jgi:hypothetical protein